MRILKTLAVVCLGLMALAPHPIETPEMNPPDRAVRAHTWNEGAEGKDWSEEQLDVASFNGTTWTDDTGGVFSFNGSSDYLYVSPWDINEFMSRTFWIKSTEAALAAVYWQEGLPSRHCFVNETAGGSLTPALKDAAGDRLSARADAAATMDGEWHFVVMITTLSTDTFDIYVDGATMVVGYFRQEGLVTITGGNNVSLGADAASSRRYLEGDIDEFFVYDYALSEEEREDLYERGKADR